MIWSLILEAYALAAKEPPMDDRARMILIGAWDKALGAIPTDRLERAFANANQANRTGFVLTAGQVLTAWDELLMTRQQEATAAPQLPAPAGIGPAPCPACHGAGWLRSPDGKPGHRPPPVRCEPCTGRGTVTTRQPAATFAVGELLGGLTAWAREHGDPSDGPLLLRYALAAAEHGLYARDLRTVLDLTDAATLHTALTEIGVPGLDAPALTAARPVAGTWHRP